MATRWQKTELNGGWKGLLARRRDILDDPLFVSICLNIDFFGGAITRRKATRLVNGATTFVAPGSTTTAIKVQDATQFAAGDTVSVFSDPAFFGSAAVVTRTLGVPNIFTNTLPVTVAFSAPPTPGQIVYVKRVLTGRIDGLFQAIFRDGNRHVLAASLGILNEIFPAPVSPAGINYQHPLSSVSVTWVSLTQGSLTNVNGLQVGDWIQITGAGVGGNPLVTQVLTINPSSGQISIGPAASSFPATAAIVVFGSPDVAGDTHFAQYANLTHISQVRPVPGTPSGVTAPPRKYNGTVVTRHGIKPPTGFPTPGINVAAGLLTGVYSYRLKFRNSATGQESEPSPHVVGDTLGAPVASQQVDISNLPISPDPQVNKKRLYRTYSGGNGVWFFVAEVSNGTTIYTDNIPDTALGSQMREFLDNTIPDSVEVIASWPHANRLMGIDRLRNAVVFSDEFDLLEGFLKGEAWPVNNQIFVNYDDGDPLVGIAPFFDSQLIFKERSIWRIIGIPPNIAIEPVSFRADQTGIGTFNQKAIVVDQNEVMFPSLDGVYHVSRYEGVQQGFQSQRLSRAIDGLWTTINRATFSPADIEKRSHAVFHRRVRQYRLFVPLTSDTVPLEPGSLLPYQFDAEIDGSPAGWALWQFRRYVFSGSVATIAQLAATASAIIQQVNANGDDGCYIGTDLGEIIELDGTMTGSQTLGIGDLLTIPIKMEYSIAPFSPAGPGIPARLRAVDLVVRQAAGQTLQLTATGDLGARASTAAPVVTFGSGSGMFRSLMLTRGVHFELDIQETSLLTAVEIHAISLWWQPLPVESVPVGALSPSVSYS